MATLTLKKKPLVARASNGHRPDGPPRAPVRGHAAARQRPTLEEAQRSRAERDAARQAAGPVPVTHKKYSERPAHRDDRPRPPAAHSPYRGPDQGSQPGFHPGPRHGQGRGPERGPDRGPAWPGARQSGPEPRGERQADRRRDHPSDWHSDRQGPTHGEGWEGRRAGPAPHAPRDSRPPRDARDRPAGPRWPDRGPAAQAPDHRAPYGAGRRDERPEGRWDNPTHRDERHRPPAHRGPDRGPAPNVGRSARPVHAPNHAAGHAPLHAPASAPGHHDSARPAPRQDQRRHDARPSGPAAGGPAPRPAGLAPPGAGERVSKRLGELGLASRREADDWIAEGWVRVDGKVAVLGQRVSRDAVIDIDPAAHQQQARRVTVLINKPIGYVSGQAEDGYEPASVLVLPANRWSEDPSGVSFHAGHSRGLAPAGRLDIDSTGLLILTQDGRIARELIGEHSTIEKEYLVRVSLDGGADTAQPPGPDAPAEASSAPMHSFPADRLALLEHGLELDGVKLKPARVSWANEDQLRFVLREGRKRQIRRMCEAVGLTVLGLKRVRIGRIPLGHLPPGQWRYLGPWEKF